MTADELVINALTASNPPKPILNLRRSRFLDGVLVAAAELLLAGERYGEDAEALHTAAMTRAGISAGHYRSLAGWTRELILVAIRNMIAMTSTATVPGTSRKGPKPKNGVPMTNAERQARFHARHRAAPKAIKGIRRHIASTKAVLKELETSLEKGWPEHFNVRCLELFEHHIEKIEKEIAEASPN